MCWSRHACAFFLFFLFVTFYGSLKLTESSRFDVVPHEYGDERSPVDPSLAPRRLSFIRRPVIVAERRRARVSFERSHAIAVLHPSRVTTRHANASRRAVPFTTRYLATVVFPVLEKKSVTRKVSFDRPPMARCRACVTLSRVESPRRVEPRADPSVDFGRAAFRQEFYRNADSTKLFFLFSENRPSRS